MTESQRRNMNSMTDALIEMTCQKQSEDIQRIMSGATPVSSISTEEIDSWLMPREKESIDSYKARVSDISQADTPAKAVTLLFRQEHEKEDILKLLKVITSNASEDFGELVKMAIDYIPRTIIENNKHLLISKAILDCNKGVSIKDYFDKFIIPKITPEQQELINKMGDSIVSYQFSRSAHLKGEHCFEASEYSMNLTNIGKVLDYTMPQEQAIELMKMALGKPDEDSYTVLIHELINLVPKELLEVYKPNMALLNLCKTMKLNNAQVDMTFKEDKLCR